MTIEECKALEDGAQVKFHEGNGWYRKVTYRGLKQVETFPKMTIDDLLNKNRFHELMKNRRTVTMAWIIWTDDRGKTVEHFVRPSRLRK